ncbi:MAG: hypothetical protein UU73_C0005G0020 [Candidatus Daviesbacteria bacterium GW2011_GWA1_41_61]|uniref:Uncharacterized protein n=1 Tax=Candidatus Daviesbacteria bacterium GW2011_GWA2_40_9 TaxID=1618424 RepID=A0A0G0U8T9_9BACT|nr:MAG: hypothetical protein UU26_C0012G0008 [Candidatus Daviesbacteria bacterium GW2011_GWC1_40_9]KKR83651.1 MAG: hypothetical protein UU29_C0003G0053 [Candidatus Daviesbacteria bacterium GW2011_GWA2_40_9]KKR92690.1 MAG: hypothetical protein UU44_C0005G0020 [Candidatus Daviesbacteria bacterium GW2011_GWB1_41_15]KKS14621.1 MAG: hypothetical protein UU73_C0005G0020 [Candidatus Daviesbacteria bacterium GW2011_GWA1_41_61]
MPTKPKINSKTIVKTKTSEELRDAFSKCKIWNDPDTVLQKVYEESINNKSNKLATIDIDNAFQALTLFEFENGILMTKIISESYKTFGVDMMRQLQKEYLCETTSEKATAELATVNYIRTLEIQSRINRYLAPASITDMGIRFLAFLSKELDRANRQYLTSIQALKAMKQIPMQLNIKTDTAIIGQNQMVQANSHE